MSALPPSAREFMGSPATEAAAQTLATLSEATLAELVTALSESDALNHLEALANAEALPKPIRKAARFSAYQLRSRGVTAPAQSKVVSLAAPTTPVDLAKAAITLLPGLYGRFWLFLGPLPGVSAIEVEGEAHGTLKRIEAVAGVAPGRLEKVVTKLGRVANHKGVAEPRIVSADLALRLLAHLEALIRLPGHPDGAGLPASWTNVLLWREAALAAGADPSRASARAQLLSATPATPLPALIPASAALMDAPLSGPHAPPPWIAEAILADVIERGEGAFEQADDLDEARRVLLEDIALAHCDAFLGREPHSTRTAHILEATADGLFALCEPELARTCLAVVDALRSGVRPREVPLFAMAYRRMVDPELMAQAKARLP